MYACSEVLHIRQRAVYNIQHRPLHVLDTPLHLVCNLLRQSSPSSPAVLAIFSAGFFIFSVIFSSAILFLYSAILFLFSAILFLYSAILFISSALLFPFSAVLFPFSARPLTLLGRPLILWLSSRAIFSATFPDKGFHRHLCFHCLSIIAKTCG